MPHRYGAFQLGELKVRVVAMYLTIPRSRLHAGGVYALVCTPIEHSVLRHYGVGVYMNHDHLGLTLVGSYSSCKPGSSARKDLCYRTRWLV